MARMFRLIAVCAVAVTGLVAVYATGFPGTSNGRMSSESERVMVLDEALALINDPFFFSDEVLPTYEADPEITGRLWPHLHPAITKEMAKAYNLKTAEFHEARMSLAIHELAMAHVSQVPDLERTLYGSTRNWSWVLIPLKPTGETRPAVLFAPCTQWLVFWNDDGWYLHNAGAPRPYRDLVRALGEFRILKRPETPCET